MKLCYDTENRISFVNGNFKVDGKSYYYKSACYGCESEFISQKIESKFCSKECRTHSSETIEKIRSNHAGQGFSGKQHTEESKQKARERNLGNIHTEETKQKMSNNHADVSGNSNPNSKNGVVLNNIPLYDTYAYQLEPVEKCVRDPEDPAILNVFCTYSECRKQYRPTRVEVSSRIRGIDNDTRRFYCSDNCKQECPLFHQSAYNLMIKDAIAANRIQVNEFDFTTLKHLDEIIQDEDKIQKCEKCGAITTLNKHHEIPKSRNPLMYADKINIWYFCDNCHKESHKLPGCGYNEIRRCV